MYEKDLIKKRSLKIKSSNKFEFDYELGYSYKDWSAYFNSTNMDIRIKEVKKIIKEYFNKNFLSIMINVLKETTLHYQVNHHLILP